MVSKTMLRVSLFSCFFHSVASISNCAFTSGHSVLCRFSRRILSGVPGCLSTNTQFLMSILLCVINTSSLLSVWRVGAYTLVTLLFKLVLRVNVVIVSTLFSSTASRITPNRSEEHTSELQSRENLVCRLL